MIIYSGNPIQWGSYRASLVLTIWNLNFKKFGIQMFPVFKRSVFRSSLYLIKTSLVIAWFSIQMLSEIGTFAIQILDIGSRLFVHFPFGFQALAQKPDHCHNLNVINTIPKFGQLDNQHKSDHLNTCPIFR